MRSLLRLVEMTGIEPVSENPLIQLSSWTVCFLKFPRANANRRAFDCGSPFLLGEVKGESLTQVHRYMTFSPESRSSREERAAKEPQHCH